MWDLRHYIGCLALIAHAVMALGTAELLERMRAFVVNKVVLLSAMTDPKAVDLFVVGGH